MEAEGPWENPSPPQPSPICPLGTHLATPYSPDHYAHQHTGWWPLPCLLGPTALLVMQGQASDSTSLCPPLPCSSIFKFLLYWLHNFPQDFCSSPNLHIVNHLKVYVRLNSTNRDPQAREILSVLEDLEAKYLTFERGEEAWGGLPGKGGVIFGDGFHQVILQNIGQKPGLDSTQGGCHTRRDSLA